MSVWIEIDEWEDVIKTRAVALYMSVWIEIQQRDAARIRLHSRTLHECVD